MKVPTVTYSSKSAVPIAGFPFFVGQRRQPGEFAVTLSDVSTVFRASP